MAGKNTTQIVSEVRSAKSWPVIVTTQKLARAERQAVQEQLGRGYEVSVTGEHEITVKKVA